MPPPIELSQSTQGIVIGEAPSATTLRMCVSLIQIGITHINVLGRTRTGKSTLMHNMIHQDIQAGKGVGLIDPHGDLRLKTY